MDILIYVALGVAATVYARTLNTKKGKSFASEYTWVSVVVGTGIVLIGLWFLIPQDSWLKVVLSFMVAGVPMIVRSLINKKR
jgi:hypothetical protein